MIAPPPARCAYGALVEELLQDDDRWSAPVTCSWWPHPRRAADGIVYGKPIDRANADELIDVAELGFRLHPRHKPARLGPSVAGHMPEIAYFALSESAGIVRSRRRGPDRDRAERREEQMTDTTSGQTRPFRFGIVAPLLSDLPTWREQVRRIADHGYSTVLMPDFPQLQPSPAAALAVAATVADVRVGTWVYAAPLRAPWLTAWEAHSLTVLTEGRFEMGIGAGRPGIEDELRERGLPVPSPGQRLDLVRATVAALRELDGEQGHTPVAMAVMGPRAQALAADIADTVTFAMAPDEPRAAVVQRVREFHTTRDVELSMHIPVVGNTVSPFMAPPHTDTAALRAADSLAYLPPALSAAADELRRRREETGVSYFAFGANVADTFAPLVAELTGR